MRRGADHWLPFDDVELRLTELLQVFGVPNSQPNPHYPFWRLRNDDDLWEVPEEQQVLDLEGGENPSGDVKVTALRAAKARGGFPPWLHERLREDPGLAHRLAADLLRLGLDEQPCAMCGAEARLAGVTLGLEAAHIQWHAIDGPDRADNGLLLCALHHRAFDLGALGIGPSCEIMVSQELVGNERAEDRLHALQGRELRRPLEAGARPHEDFIHWHWDQVFRGPARSA